MLDRVFRRVTLIQIVTLLTAVISMLVDSIIIAKYLGVTCVAAYGLAAPILTLFAAIGGTFAQGAQTTASKALGTGDTDLASRLLSVAVLIGLIVSTPLPMAMKRTFFLRKYTSVKKPVMM